MYYLLKKINLLSPLTPRLPTVNAQIRIQKFLIFSTNTER